MYIYIHIIYIYMCIYLIYLFMYLYMPYDISYPELALHPDMVIDFI